MPARADLERTQRLFRRGPIIKHQGTTGHQHHIQRSIRTDYRSSMGDAGFIQQVDGQDLPHRMTNARRIAGSRIETIAAMPIQQFLQQGPANPAARSDYCSPLCHGLNIAPEPGMPPQTLWTMPEVW